MIRDTLTHGRKTIAGLDLTYGETTTTPCGKRRPALRSKKTALNLALGNRAGHKHESNACALPLERRATVTADT